VHACGGANNGREKRNVVIVSVLLLLPIIGDLAPRSNASGCVEVAQMRRWMREHGVLLRVATAHHALVNAIHLNAEG